MHQINCPFCGIRDEVEFSYQGDATKKRPQGFSKELPENLEQKIDEFYDYVYIRNNPQGWHIEWWHHIQGCRQYLKVVRNTQTHQINQVCYANEKVELLTHQEKQ